MSQKWVVELWKQWYSYLLVLKWSWKLLIKNNYLNVFPIICYFKNLIDVVKLFQLVSYYIFTRTWEGWENVLNSLKKCTIYYKQALSYMPVK